MSRNQKKTIDGRISSYLWIDLSNFNKSYRKNVSYDKVFSRKNTFVKTTGGHDDYPSSVITYYVDTPLADLLSDNFIIT